MIFCRSLLLALTRETFLKLAVAGDELLVQGLHFLARGFELLVRRLELLVHRDRFFVERRQLLFAASRSRIVLSSRVARRFQLLLELAGDQSDGFRRRRRRLGWRRKLAKGISSSSTPSCVAGRAETSTSTTSLSRRTLAMAEATP